MARFWLYLLLIGSLGIVGCQKEAETPKKNKAPSPQVAEQTLRVRDGKVVYAEKCASCHGPNGEGRANMTVSFQGNEWTTGGSGRLVRILLNGMEGKRRLDENAPYLSAKKAPMRQMGDEEIADVLSFIRYEWGNKAEMVRAEDIKILRLFTAERTKPWTVDELSLRVNAGYPGLARIF